MFTLSASSEITLRQISKDDAPALFTLIDKNRTHLGAWHPWVNATKSVADVERTITQWDQQSLNNRGIQCGIYVRRELVGVIGHLSIDWANRGTWLTYWLAESAQGHGTMTMCVRAMIVHSFEAWKLNRVTIECATQNMRSCRVAQRAGMRGEGICRQAEWLNGKFVDHVLYGLVKEDWNGMKTVSAKNRLEAAIAK